MNPFHIFRGGTGCWLTFVVSLNNKLGSCFCVCGAPVAYVVGCVVGTHVVAVVLLLHISPVG